MATECKCGKIAHGKCSRCHNKYFCSPECVRRFWPEHQRSCFGIDKALADNVRNVSLREAMRLGTLSNYQFYENVCRDHHFAGTPIPVDVQARRFLFRGLTRAVMLDPTGIGYMSPVPPGTFSFTWEDADRDIRAAGSLYNALGGYKRMKEEFKLSGPPSYLRLYVSTRWESIGTWKAK